MGMVLVGPAAQSNLYRRTLILDWQRQCREMYELVSRETGYEEDLAQKSFRASGEDEAVMGPMNHNRRLVLVTQIERGRE